MQKRVFVEDENRITKTIRFKFESQSPLQDLKSKISNKFGGIGNDFNLFYHQIIIDPSTAEGKRVSKVDIMDCDDVNDIAAGQVIYITKNNRQIIATNAPNTPNAPTTVTDFRQRKAHKTLYNSKFMGNLRPTKYGLKKGGFCYCCDSFFPSLEKNKNAAVAHYESLHISLSEWAQQENPNEADLPKIMKGSEKRKSKRQLKKEEKERKRKYAQIASPLPPINNSFKQVNTDMEIDNPLFEENSINDSPQHGSSTLMINESEFRPIIPLKLNKSENRKNKETFDPTKGTTKRKALLTEYLLKKRMYLPSDDERYTPEQKEKLADLKSERLIKVQKEKQKKKYRSKNATTNSKKKSKNKKKPKNAETTNRKITRSAKRTINTAMTDTTTSPNKRKKPEETPAETFTDSMHKHRKKPSILELKTNNSAEIYCDSCTRLIEGGACYYTCTKILGTKHKRKCDYDLCDNCAVC